DCNELFTGSLLGSPFACTEAPLQEFALHRVARQGKRRSKVLARNAMLPAAKLELPHCRSVEGIAGKASAVRDRTYLFQPTVGAISLRDRNRTIERDNRRRTDRQQRVVERNDARPIRVLDPGSGRVNRRNGRLDVILGEIRTRGRKLQQLEPFQHELLV